MPVLSRFRRPIPSGEQSAGRRRLRTVVAAVATVLAALLVWAALVAPDDLNLLRPGTFLRIPVEGLLLVALALVLPPRVRRYVVAPVGVVLGLLIIVKVLDMGFRSALDRPFNPVTDWGYFGPAVGVLDDSVGRAGAIGAVAGAVLLVAGLLVLVTLSILRLIGFAAGHRTGSIRALAALGAVWIVCAVFGVRVVADTPVASSGTATLAYGEGRDVAAGIRNQREFAGAIAADPFRSTPGADLLTGLRGKDVIIAFVESYGRVAVHDLLFSPGVDAVLDAGSSRLRAAGYSARSAFFTSPTFGGVSWLAHSTLQSGLWINDQQRYNALVTSNRVTLSVAFQRAGWRTVGDVPSNHQDWPEGTSFYHYDTVYGAGNVGYRGPGFSFASMPDQYILSTFQRLELARPGHHHWGRSTWYPATRRGRRCPDWSTGARSATGRSSTGCPSRASPRTWCGATPTTCVRPTGSRCSTRSTPWCPLWRRSTTTISSSWSSATTSRPPPSPARTRATTCPSRSSPVTRPYWIGSPRGAGRTGCVPGRRRWSGGWTPSGTGSSPRTAPRRPRSRPRRITERVRESAAPRVRGRYPSSPEPVCLHDPVFGLAEL